jgi:ABC-type glycerol-3-phosphate transport system permease component
MVRLVPGRTVAQIMLYSFSHYFFLRLTFFLIGLFFFIIFFPYMYPGMIFPFYAACVCAVCPNCVGVAPSLPISAFAFC